jgi:hypothetical protein
MLSGWHPEAISTSGDFWRQSTFVFLSLESKRLCSGED